MNDKLKIKEAEAILTSNFDYVGKYSAVKFLCKNHFFDITIACKAYDNLVMNHIY